MPVIERPDISGAIPAPGSPGILVPIDYAREIIRGARDSSFAMRNFRVQRMPAYAQVMPVLTALPTADWVSEQPLTGAGSEASKKPTTEPTFQNAVLRAEEAAAIVVIPEAVLYDASIDLFAELRPMLTDALGKVVDEAILFGGTGSHAKPASWDDGIITQALAAGGHAADDPDFPGAVSDAMADLEAVGYIPNLIGGGPGLLGGLRGLRDADGRPVYLDNMRTDTGFGSVWGVGLDISRNGAWDSDVAVAAVFDTTKIIVGVREDITFKVLTEATIDVSPNRDGSALVYLAQQDCVALRVRYRIAWTSTEPVTGLGSRVPASVITPAAPPTP